MTSSRTTHETPLKALRRTISDSPFTRPAVVLAGALAFLGVFLRGYLAGGRPQMLPILLAVGGMAVIASGLIVAIVVAQRQERQRVTRALEEDLRQDRVVSR